MQFFILHRAYMSPANINKVFPLEQATCPRCTYADANMIHMIWACPTLLQYWQDVFTQLGQTMNVTQTAYWETCTLGTFQRTNLASQETDSWTCLYYWPKGW